MKQFLFLFFLAMFGLSGCSNQPAGKPPDFSLSLYWHTGTLPEPHNYSYSINIGPLTGGELHYQSGDSTKNYSADYTISEEDLDELYDLVIGLGLLRNKWEKGDPLDGAPATIITITSGGKKYTIPEISELAEDERILTDKLVNKIEALVPPDLWEEMHSIQSEYILNYDE